MMMRTTTSRPNERRFPQPAGEVATWRRVPSMVVLAALVLVIGCKGAGEGEGDGEGKVQPEVSVQLATVQLQPFRETITAIGAVQPRAGHVASLGAPGPARVARVMVAVGDRVSAAATLVELEQAPFQAGVKSAEAQLSAAEHGFERAQRLSEQGILARRDVELATTELEQARANVLLARRASELSILRAPFGGIVTRMDAVLGASVDANQTLVEVADPSALDVVLRVTPGDAARIRTGSPVELSAGESARGEALGSATVVEVAGTVDSSTRSVSVRVRGRSLRRSLRIGETVFGEIALQTRQRTVTIPTQALVPDGDGFTVFVVDSSNIAHVQAVTVGARTDSLAEIVEGLKGGERIVTYGAFGVSDSAKVVQVKK